MKCARCSTLTESTWITPVRARVRLSVRIVGGSCGGSRKPWAARATRRACAGDSDVRRAVTPTDRRGDGERTDANLAVAGDNPRSGVVRRDDFRPTLADRLAPALDSAQNRGVRFSGGMTRSRVLGRLAATTAALALAGTAVVLMGQGAS